MGGDFWQKVASHVVVIYHFSYRRFSLSTHTLDGVTNISCIGRTVARYCATTSFAVRFLSATSLCIRLMNRMSGSCSFVSLHAGVYGKENKKKECKY